MKYFDVLCLSLLLVDLLLLYFWWIYIGVCIDTANHVYVITLGPFMGRCSIEPKSIYMDPFMAGSKKNK